jgi:hypothetical protein
MTDATKEGDAQMQRVDNTDHERHCTVVVNDGALSTGVFVDDTSSIELTISYSVIRIVLQLGFIIPCDEIFILELAPDRWNTQASLYGELI